MKKLYKLITINLFPVNINIKPQKKVIMTEALYNEFTKEIHTANEKSVKLGYYPSRFLQMAEQSGSVQAAKKMVTSGAIPNGMKKLKKMRKLDLTIESIMIKEKYQSLFTVEELNAAKWRLNSV